MTLQRPGAGLHAGRRADDRDRVSGWRRSGAIRPSGDQWSPGFFHVELTADEPAVLVASAEPWETMLAMPFDEALRAERQRRSRLLKSARRILPGEDAFHAELVLAADQFLIKPAGRVEDAARAQAAGEDIRTVIAGYHWFTDWGRDTMISLEGLTLSTGRAAEAEFILRTFAHYVRDGLIPNMFPEGADRGPLPHRRRLALVLPRGRPLRGVHRRPRDALGPAAPADRDRRSAHRGDAVRHRRRPARRPAPPGGRGVSAHLDGRQGRRLGRHAAARQGGRDQRALVQRAAAARGLGARGPRRRGRRAVRRSTPRRRGPRSTRGSGTRPAATSTTSSTASTGDDPACRPNQLFAFSLDHEVLDRSRWEPVLDVVRREAADAGRPPLAGPRASRLQAALLRRPAGPRRGLSPGDGLGLADRPVRRRLAEGPPRRPRRRPAVPRRLPRRISARPRLGTISEIFDAEPPYTPRGCIAQAWSVAEVLRSWVKTAEPIAMIRIRSRIAARTVRLGRVRFGGEGPRSRWPACGPSGFSRMKILGSTEMPANSGVSGGLPPIEVDPHREALDDLDEVARRVLGRQQGRGRAGARG